MRSGNNASNIINPESAKQEIKILLEKYDKIINEKRLNSYNEEMTKKDFILPLFRALGWNTEDSKEVSAEEKISKKRVDYSFRICGIPKFFLEAKSLKENLDNPRFIEQATNYAWHKGCTWAVLTDFESVKIYNAEWKTVNPLQSHFKTIACNEFIERFDELRLLSKESFENGCIDREAEKWGKKTKRISIDKQLLADFTRFRELLSKNVTKLNQNLNIEEEELDEAIQRILDRLIFIRNCEDRELEAKTLIPILREQEKSEKKNIIPRLREAFSYFDREYNSKMFAKHLCDDLNVDDEIIYEIIEGLYFTKDKSISYDFSAIEADVLGDIYEQYLGHILRKSEKRAKLLKNHVHRKEQGIYYTPNYIVDYIVKNTLGELLKKNNNNYKNIRVLDPACGSGSFLIKAFDVLNEHYAKIDKHYKQTQMDFKTGDAFTGKVRILQNNIFGVDLDRQAIEIAQLNLLLKIAEKGRRLPLLLQNIKCGNSLIDNPLIAGNKAFNWREEFGQVMDAGGFDVVFGNPPYVRNRELKKNEKEFFKNNYITAEGQYDIYQLFFERAIGSLKNGAFLGFITSNKYAVTSYGKKLRKFILDNCQIISIVDISNIQVFKEASNYPYIIILRKESDEKSRNNSYCNVIKAESEDFESVRPVKIKQKDFLKDKGFNFNISINKKHIKLIKITEEGAIQLGDIVSIKETVHTGNIRGKLIVDSRLNNKCRKILRGKDCQRYYYKWNNLWLVNDRGLIDKNKGEYATIPDGAFFSKPKIFLREIAEKITCCYDEEGFYSLNKAYVINQENEDLSLKFIIGLLNSKLLSWYFKEKFESAHVRGGYLQFKKQYASQIPIKLASHDEKNKIIALVDKIIELHKRYDELARKKTDERMRIEADISNTSEEIDELVYKIYGITEAEKKIINGL